jgi:hypothetical protein
MKSKGIRIEDENEIGAISVALSDILEEIQDGNAFQWSILEIEAFGNFGEGRTYKQLEKEVNDSKNGFFIAWEELNVLSRKFDQIIWITVIGCKDEKLLRYYKTDQEMYETCDIVIEMFDSSCWEVFSKDENLINRLSAKFKDIKLLETDFQTTEKK